MDRYYQPDLKKIEAILIKKGWSVAEIAKNGPLSQRTVDSIMQGRPIFRSTLWKLAKALEVDNPSDLLPSDVPPVEPVVKKNIMVIAFQYDAGFETFDETDGFDKLLSAIKDALRQGCSINPQVFTGSLLVTFDIEKHLINSVLHFFFWREFYRQTPYGFNIPQQQEVQQREEPTQRPLEPTIATDPTFLHVFDVLSVSSGQEVYHFRGHGSH